MTSVVIQGNEGAPTVALERPMSTERGMAYGGDPYGHGVLVVVRAGESPAHGEGGQVSTTNKHREVCRMQNAATVLNVTFVTTLESRMR